MTAKNIVYVNEFTNGILDPNEEMAQTVKDGGHIVANTAAGCWGPMITPSLRGGHEVTKPVFVEGAEVGDAIAIKIKSIAIASIATASGSDEPVEGRFLGDPFVAVKCPECETLYPETVIKGLGQEAIRCAKCDADITPFRFTSAYTMTFNDNKDIGLTVNQEAAEKIGKDGQAFMATPENSVQNPVVTFAPHDIVGAVARIRPFLGQLGTTPSLPLPDSHNAGDFAQALIDAPHEYGVPEAELEGRTDGHMDINRVREGAILICPVKVEGGGVYLGDMHAMQGDGEIAGHTTDVSGVSHVQVNVIKGLELDGPILLPVEEDLPYLAKPLTEAEKERAEKLATEYGVSEIEESYPISFVGTGATLNDATDNGMERAAKLFSVDVPEISNRATITGAIEIGRNPGVATVTFRAPKKYLDKVRLTELIKEQYQL